MTKTYGSLEAFTQSTKQEKTSKKPIEFCKSVSKTGYILKTVINPKQWGNVILLIQSEDNDYDIMFAFDNNAKYEGVVYLGHWNDGVVE